MPSQIRCIFQPVIFDHIPSRHDLTFVDHLISKSHQFIFLSGHINLANLEKFPQVIFKISCSQTFRIQSRMDARTA